MAKGKLHNYEYNLYVLFYSAFYTQNREGFFYLKVLNSKEFAIMVVLCTECSNIGPTMKPSCMTVDLGGHLTSLINFPMSIIGYHRLV